MALKDLLVTIDASDAGNARMGLAMRLAKHHRARLVGYYVSPTVGTYDLPPAAPLVGMPVVAPLPTPDNEHAGDVAETMEQRFADDLRQHGVEGSWLLSGQDTVRDLSQQLRVCDLAILGQVDPDRPLRDQGGFQPEAVILESGRPGLVVPYIGSTGTLGTRVLVAWDGSRVASRALHEALAMIEPGAAVTVLTVESGDGATIPSADMVTAHLRRHGIQSVPEHTAALDQEIADIILSRAADFSADLIVAGAYGHSRLRESLLGGTSRALFERMTTPVLMSH
jgi:nucleotide-binding universal stress UspA family protein